MNRSSGLTLVEVLVAVAVLAIVLVSITAPFIFNLQSASNASLHTQASQILSTLTAQIEQQQILLAPSSSQVFLYTPHTTVLSSGSPPSSCSSYLSGGDHPDQFCGTATNQGDYNPSSLLSTPMNSYYVAVCWSSRGGGEACVHATTLE